MRQKIIFYLNGKRKEAGAEQASMMLADYLRYDQSLTGTKIVCAEGDCGACSVLRYFPHVPTSVDAQNYLAVNSCITVLAQLDGSSLVTVDALKKNEELHPAQSAMVKCHGSQCGFCTPGFVMAITGMMEEKISKSQTTLTSQEAKNCMTGNLCRCTGYQPIIDAALSIDLKNVESIKSRFYSDHQAQELRAAFAESVHIESEHFSFFAPKTLKEALLYLKANPDAKIMGAATDLGVIHNKRKITLTKLVSLHLMSELYSIDEKAGMVQVGARVTLTELRHFMKDKISEFAHYLDIFASPQIKNIGTVIGNIANASPIGDTPSAFLALNATVCVYGDTGEREVALSEFFLAYRTINIKPGEIITAIKFKLPEVNSTLKLYKNSNRKDLDISAVNLAINVAWTDQTQKELKEITIAAGGVAATPLRLKKTETFLKSRPLSQATIDLAVKEFHSEFKPLSDVRATSAYRRVLIENYFRKFFTDAGVGQ